MEEKSGQEPTSTLRIKKTKTITGQSLTAVKKRKRLKALFLAGVTALGIGGGAKLSSNINQPEEPKSIDTLNSGKASDPTGTTLTTSDLLATSEKLNEEASPFFNTVYVPQDKITAPEIIEGPTETPASNKPETKKEGKTLVMIPQRNNNRL